MSSQNSKNFTWPGVAALALLLLFIAWLLFTFPGFAEVVGTVAGVIIILLVFRTFF
jgi:hypothetical protein